MEICGICTYVNIYSHSSMFIFTQICVFFSDLKQINFKDTKSTGMSKYINKEIYKDFMKCQCVETDINHHNLLQHAIKEDVMTVCVTKDTHQLFVYCPIASITYKKVIQKRTSFNSCEIINLIFHFNFFDHKRDLIYGLVDILSNHTKRLQILSEIYIMERHVHEPGHADTINSCNKCSEVELKPLVEIALEIYTLFNKTSIRPQLKRQTQNVSSEELFLSERKLATHDKHCQNKKLRGKQDAPELLKYDHNDSLCSTSRPDNIHTPLEIFETGSQKISESSSSFCHSQDAGPTNSNIVVASLNNSERTLGTQVSSELPSNTNNQPLVCLVPNPQSKANCISKKYMRPNTPSPEKLEGTEDFQFRMGGNFDSRESCADIHRIKNVSRLNTNKRDKSNFKNKKTPNSRKKARKKNHDHENELVSNGTTSNASSHEHFKRDVPHFDMFGVFTQYFDQYFDQFSLICYFLETLDTKKDNLLKMWKIFDSVSPPDTRSSNHAFFTNLYDKFGCFLSFARSIFNYEFIYQGFPSTESILFDNGPLLANNVQIYIESVVFLVDTIRIDLLKCLQNISLLCSLLWNDQHPLDFIILFEGLKQQNEHSVQLLLSHQLFSRSNIQTVVCVFDSLTIPVRIEGKFQLDLQLSPIIIYPNDPNPFMALQRVLDQNSLRYLQLHAKIEQNPFNCNSKSHNSFFQIQTSTTASTSTNASSHEQNLTNENCFVSHIEPSQITHGERSYYEKRVMAPLSSHSMKCKFSLFRQPEKLHIHLKNNNRRSLNCA